MTSATSAESTGPSPMSGPTELGASPAGGFVPFDLYMDEALYSREAGFYQQESEVVGPRGAYYTAPHASPLYVATFARRISAALRSLVGPPAPRIVEVGPGDGRLAAGILSALAQENEAPPGLGYTLVDRAAPRLEQSFRAAERAAESTSIRVRRAMRLGEEGPFRGVVIFHELLDAQPVRRFEVDQGEWRELGVSSDRGRGTPQSRPARCLPPAMPEAAALEDGTIVEVAPAAETLLRDVGDLLVEGLAIVVDYGMEEDELVHGHPRGTLEGLRGHRVVSDPLLADEPRDLSVFVNWTRLRRAGERAGLRLIADEPLSRALLAWGIEPLARAAQAKTWGAEDGVRLQLGLKNLLFGFERFRALEFVTGTGR